MDRCLQCEQQTVRPGICAWCYELEAAQERLEDAQERVTPTRSGIIVIPIGFTK